MLSGFGDAVSIARASVMGDFAPFGWVSIPFMVTFSMIFCLSKLFIWSSFSSAFLLERRLGWRRCDRLRWRQGNSE